MSVLHVTTDTFEKEVLQAEQTVLVDFWAAWCGPCKMLSPIVDEVAAAHPDLKICKVNVDEAGDLAIQYQVMSIPTLIIFRNGQIAHTSVGLQSKTDIEKLLS